MKAIIIGRYYRVRGNRTPRWLLITDFEELPKMHEEDIDAVLKRAEGHL
jgi:ssDNA-binding replication factor A large subunit